jgi:uncharacterized protein with FMN-binding domain
MTHGLVALSSAAVVAVYLAGYARTEPATTGLISAAPATGELTTTAATAVPSTQLVASAPATTAATLRDGTYVGTGVSRFGNIQATVVVIGGRVTSAEITSCGTSYPCSRITALPGQVVARQSAAVDIVSGATASSLAYQQAVTAALAQAR